MLNAEKLDETEDINDVLIEFAAAREAAPDDKSLLRFWTNRYPQFADELIAVDYAWLMTGMTLTDALEDGLEDAEITALGREIIQAQRQEAQRQEAQRQALKPPLTSLVSDAAVRGLDAGAMASALRLDRLLLGRLEQRLLDAATLPVSLVQQIAQILGRSTDEVAAYLRGGPRLAMQAQYRARRAPSLPASEAEAMSFAQALEASSNLSEEDRAHWQAEIENGVLGEAGLPRKRL